MLIPDVSLFMKVMGKGYPVLLMHGGPGADLHTLMSFKRLTDRFTLIDRAGHNPQDEQPSEVIRLIRSFLNILGLIIEAASGESYPDYIQKHIFNPLDMRHSDPIQGTAFLIFEMAVLLLVHLASKG